MRSFGILAIHGMGRPNQDFAASLEAGLRERLPAEMRAAARFRPVHYSALVQGQQDAVWRRMRGQGLAYGALRDFLLAYLSDAAVYEARPGAKESVYVRVHAAIQAQLAAFEREEGADCPLVVVAHSLGCQVISNYLWDAQSPLSIGLWKERPLTALEALRTARLLVTTGANIPAFVAGLPEIQAVRAPGPAFRWLNLYDRHDPLGWPLRPLSESYAQVVSEDRQVNVGLLPWCHTRYWEDRSVLDVIAGEVRRAVESA